MDSTEAGTRLAELHDELKIELSPSYLNEVPELDELTIDGIKRAYILRNKLARVSRGVESGGDQDALWDELEGVFLS